ncbi:hypothetical protein [Methylobacterium longum]|uniref:Transposase n=1 Tax=Methylobacterium longum TaxID=767694 RepID=A0ABT8AV49_9HYPH|nr:hypothetical protein [Methylobacterium longum]MDN3573833.1 hypothetical protein [Methylobacterium longum]GJE15108.1 hypothetical protein FOHLNKBM_6186 [Methylobacterium longum]
MDQLWLKGEQFAGTTSHLPTDTLGKKCLNERRVISRIVRL